jgi:hypothetical protein
VIVKKGWGGRLDFRELGIIRVMTDYFWIKTAKSTFIRNSLRNGLQMK